MTDEEKTNRNTRTIQVVNIPLEIPTFQIRGAFQKYGTIEQDKGIYTKVRGMYQTAFITYENEADIQNFYDNTWSVYIGKHLVSVIPILLSKEKREVRNNFCIKLSGLPFNTFALDLRNLLVDIHAKYCFIPRNPNNNNPLKHAYVYFENEEECIIASEKDN
jgi:RNA recognition motif-containing protein